MTELPSVSIHQADDWVRRAVLRGKYDLLIRLRREQGRTTPKPTARGASSIQRLIGWICEPEQLKAASADSWPLERDQIAKLSTYYSRSGLLLEALIERPALSDLIDETALPTAQRAQRLLNEFPTALANFSGRRDVGIADWRTLLTGYKYCAVIRILRAMQTYRIFETDDVALASIERELTAVEAHLRNLQAQMDALMQARSTVQEVALLPSEIDEWKSLSKMDGVQGLLQLSLARVYRAQGASKMKLARKCLTRALEHYEMRIAREARLFSTGSPTQPDLESVLSRLTHEQRRDRRSHILSSSYRSAVVLCQDAYLAFLESRLTDAASTIKASRLLALVSGDNQVLESEIELVSLCINRSLLSPAAIADNNSVEIQKRQEVLRGLEKVQAFNEAYGRVWYVNMCLFQIAHCRSYRKNRLPSSLRIASKIFTGDGEQKSRSGAEAQRFADSESFTLAEDYWAVSANTLKLTLSNRSARFESNESRETLNRAVGFGRLALRIAGTRPELNHLRAECNARLAEAHAMLGNETEAEKCIALATPPAVELSGQPLVNAGGYTTQPFTTALCVLVEADIAISRGQHMRANGLISRFEQASLPHVESEWLREHYRHTRSKLAETTDVFLITPALLTADQKQQHRKLTYLDLKAKLKSFLYDAAVGTSGHPISDAELAKKLGVNPKTATQFRESILKARGQLPADAPKRKRGRPRLIRDSEELPHNSSGRTRTGD